MDAIFTRAWQTQMTAWQNFARSLTVLGWRNFLVLLVLVSAFFWLWEILLPWRKNQSILRKDFWLDGFYMLFIMLFFPLLGFAFVYAGAEALLLKLLGPAGLRGLQVLPLDTLPVALQLLILFVIRDFVHWLVHNCLHRIPFLWRFHKVHHSVEEMGFAAHLRYHWIENVLYRLAEYFPLASLGLGPVDFFLVYATGLVIGHFNHANIFLPLGPLRFLINNPQMHIWHHARDLPPEHPKGMNFGLSLSLWDFLFGTASVPADGRDIALGFPGRNSYPNGFWGQMLYPFRSEDNDG